MTFTPDIPRTGQTLGNSRPQVVGNFTTIHRAFSVDSASGNQTGDHFDYDTANEGKHLRVRLPAIGVTPPTTAAGEGAIYTQDIGGGVINPFFRRESNGASLNLLGLNLIQSGTITNVNTTLQDMGSDVPINSIGFYVLTSALGGQGPSGYGGWFSNATIVYPQIFTFATNTGAASSFISSFFPISPPTTLKIRIATTLSGFDGDYNYYIYQINT